MTALTSPKGPLPPRVYWTRRVLLLGVTLLLVFGIARVLGDGSDARSTTPKAARAAASTSADGPADDPADDPANEGATSATTDEPAPPAESPAAGTGKKKKKKATTPEPPAPPVPTGVCTNEDIAITPSADGAAAGGQVQFLLTMRTKVTPACTWQVSADTVTLKITSGDDDIWASRECRDSIPTQDVTLYRDYDTPVPVIWSGRRSDEDCSKLTEWADAGWYHLLVAPYAGEPVDLQFELGVPAPVTVTKTVEPATGTKGNKKGDAADSPAGEPSGAVEPNGG